jgi:hypothetical protein
METGIPAVPDPSSTKSHPSTLPSWAVALGSALAAGLTTAGYGHLSTPVVSVIDASAALLVALHVHVALPRAARAAVPRVAAALRALVD